MEIPFSRWYPAVDKRRSRRKYDPSRPVPADVMADLHYTCLSFRPFPCARTELVTASPDDVFRGAVGSYGKVKSASAYLAFVGDMRDPHVQETAGYTGEGIILEAVSLGLSTCWVAGFFRPEAVARHVKIASNERVLAVSPVGYAGTEATLEEKFMAGFGRHARRKPLSRLVSGLPDNEWPAWVKPALEAARLAPSAINRQPWTFHVDKDSITVYTTGSTPDFKVSRRLDCGIAMLHLEVAALSQGIRGNWDFLNSPRVARFSF